MFFESVVLLLLKSAHDRQVWLIKITTTTTKKLSVFLQVFFLIKKFSSFKNKGFKLKENVGK